MDSLIRGGKACEAGGISDIEELAKFMTFQIAFIAEDGWVLASDTRAYHPAFVRTQREPAMQVAVLSPTRKIENCEESKFIYAFSGGAFSQETGVILRKLAPQFSPSQRKELLIAAVRECRKVRPNDQEGGESLIVVFRGPQPELWTLDIDHVQPKIETQWGWGGGGSLALLFPQCFYARRPAADLKRLAAYSVIVAGLCNPTVVDGLEIWSGSGDQIIQQADELELRDLTKHALHVHERIKSMIVGTDIAMPLP